MTLPEPLPEPIETTANVSDFYTTKKFREIMEHADNADVARMVVVGLATADPARPAPEPEGMTEKTAKARQHASVSFTDKDGDTIRLHYLEGTGPSGVVERVVAIAIDGNAVAIPVDHLAPIVAYLGARLAGVETTEP